MPRDDPDITDHKATWAGKAMQIVQQEICQPLERKTGKHLPPMAIGPLVVSMMSSRFLFAPVLEQVRPPGYNEDYFKQYPHIITTIFLHGLHGLISPTGENNDATKE
jgi:hypothetical protein